MSVFYGLDEKIIGKEKWLTEKYINPSKQKYNTNAQIFLMGCEAGMGDKCVAQKIANKFSKKTGVAVYAFTPDSLATTNSNRINEDKRATQSEIDTKFSTNTKKLYFFGVNGKGLKRFTKQ